MRVVCVWYHSVFSVQREKYKGRNACVRINYESTKYTSFLILFRFVFILKKPTCYDNVVTYASGQDGAVLAGIQS